MADQFKDKVAIVTGGASGIGRALCGALSERGAFVVVADIAAEQAQAVAAAIAASDGRAQAVRLDVTQPEQVHKLVADIASEHGRLDYMFNNAALSLSHREVRDVPLEDWHRIINVNLLGVLYGTVAAYALMVRQGFGHIVNTASLAGLVGFPTHIPYGVTKAALVGLSTQLRLEAADLGVKVSVVCPGHVHARTGQGRGLLGPDRAAWTILRGVAQNRAMIIFPLHARILWRLYRLRPQLLFPLGRKMVRDFRAGKREGKGH